MIASGSAFSVAACLPAESETEDSYSALYSSELGVALTEEANDLLEANGYAQSALELVVADEIYTLSDENLPTLKPNETYPPLADSLQIGRIELVGSVATSALSSSARCVSGPLLTAPGVGSPASRLLIYGHKHHRDR